MIRPHFSTYLRFLCFFVAYMWKIVTAEVILTPSSLKREVLQRLKEMMIA